MKKQSTTLFANISRDQVISLTTTVSETLDFEYRSQPKIVFTAAELWNIQRRKKATSLRKFSF